MIEAVVYKVERDWEPNRRYRVESLRDVGAWRWETSTVVGDESVAKTIAHALVNDNGHYKARVIDTQVEDEQ